jgi:hypothetical protein
MQEQEMTDILRGMADEMCFCRSAVAVELRRLGQEAHGDEGIQEQHKRWLVSADFGCHFDCSFGLPVKNREDV